MTSNVSHVCQTGKVRFGSEKAAKVACKKIRKRGTGDAMRVSKFCTLCGGFHLLRIER